MRWDGLFADLELQLDAALEEDLHAQIAERTRRELASTSFEGRLRAAAGRPVELTVAGAGALSGELRRVGPGWLMLDIRGGLPAVVATDFVVSARDLPVSAREAAYDEDASGTRGLGHVLRVLARDRTPTAVALASGATFTGTVDRVGTDYLDLAEHSLDEPRRTSVIRGTRTIALSGVAMLRPRLD